MKKNVFNLIILLVLMIFTPVHTYPYRIERADQMNLTVKVDITFNSETKEYVYTYTITSHEDSLLELEKIIFEYDGELSGWSRPRPSRWNSLRGYLPSTRNGLPHSFESFTPNNMRKFTWWAYSDGMLKPNNTQSGFVIKAKGGVPGITTFYAMGFTPPVNTEAYPENPEMLDLFANSLKGKTLGPVLEPILPPTMLDPMLFSGFIVGYIDEALQLKWITDTTVANSIKDKLNSAKGYIDKDNPKAIDMLQALLDDLDAQHGKSINDDAYLLIKLNTIHLRNSIK